MTILDYCISLKTNKKILVVLGVVDMRQLLLNGLEKGQFIQLDDVTRIKLALSIAPQDFHTNPQILNPYAELVYLLTSTKV